MPAAGDAAALQQTLAEAARSELADASSFLFFDAAGEVLASGGLPQAVDKAELKPLVDVLGDRTSAVRSGMVVGGRRYEVHRHHPPLVYGRTMGVADPGESEGAALCAVTDGTVTGRPCYGFITYR